MRPFVQMTWEDVQQEWDSLDKEGQGHIWNWVANARPEFDFANWMSRHFQVCNVHHADKDLINSMTGVSPLYGVEQFDFNRSVPPDWNPRAVLVEHPHLGCFVVTPDANPIMETPLWWPVTIRLEQTAALLGCCLGEMWFDKR